MYWLNAQKSHLQAFVSSAEQPDVDLVDLEAMCVLFAARD